MPPSRWHRKLLERATLLVLLPPDVVLTYPAAWQSFLQHVSMKESEVLRFEDSAGAALRPSTTALPQTSAVW